VCLYEKREKSEVLLSFLTPQFELLNSIFFNLSLKIELVEIMAESENNASHSETAINEEDFSLRVKTLDGVEYPISIPKTVMIRRPLPCLCRSDADTC
jgi:hypothetical protein